MAGGAGRTRASARSAGSPSRMVSHVTVALVVLLLGKAQCDWTTAGHDVPYFVTAAGAVQSGFPAVVAWVIGEYPT